MRVHACIPVVFALSTVCLSPRRQGNRVCKNDPQERYVANVTPIPAETIPIVAQAVADASPQSVFFRNRPSVGRMDRRIELDLVAATFG